MNRTRASITTLIAVITFFSFVAQPVAATDRRSSPQILFKEQMVSSKHLEDGNYSVTFKEPTVSTSPGETWHHGIDGGVYALDNQGNFQMALSAPVVEGKKHSWEIEQSSLRVNSKVSPDSTVHAVAGASLIKSVEKSKENKKPRYKITPTKLGRATPSGIHATAGWSEAIAKGVDKPTEGLHQQYVCHPISKVARFKDTWNIEAWRPTVGLPKTIAQACNPK